ncbi:MAG: hypothetical protein IPL58_00880 [Betaproteobacteria bacterium]|uniref:Uncharacterized protein n=1 Tax=Candidatus Proximibacter danicus TaxID=2954365 RepID=A0A9D7JY40_9PROT|nr:hypothetical protein [Candidatus Proximibacter danicus]
MIRQRCSALVLLLLLSAATLPAHAFPGGGVGRGGWMQVKDRPQQPQRDHQFQQPQRQQESHRQGQQGQQRMSPDERRQLRRDLHDAGRDVYPQRREGRR